MITPPVAVRFNHFVPTGAPFFSSLQVELGTLLPAGTIWHLSFQQVRVADYFYLKIHQSEVLFQVLYPEMQRWTRPLFATYQVDDFHRTRLTLPGIMGKMQPGFAGNTHSTQPLANFTIHVTLTRPGYFDVPKFYATFYG